MGSLYVSDITHKDVLRALKPIWEAKHETAKRTRGYIEGVLSWATAHGLGKKGSRRAICASPFVTLLRSALSGSG